MAVYWIGHPDSSDPVKIGTSGLSEARLAQGQTWHWKPLEILGEVPGDQRLEFSIHRHLRSHRLQGEWFERGAAMELLEEFREHGTPIVMGEAFDAWVRAHRFMVREDGFPPDNIQRVVEQATSAPHMWFDRTSVEGAVDAVLTLGGDLEPARLPAPSVFLDLEGSGSSLVEGCRMNGYCAGALVTEDQANGSLAVVALVQHVQQGPDARPLPPFNLVGSGIEVTDAIGEILGSDDGDHSVRNAMSNVGVLVHAALMLLSCANVELVDAPVSRAERRRAAREGRPGPKIVDIRPTGKRYAESEPTGRMIKQRHLVRAHFKHFPVTTRLGAKADKTVRHNGVECRRIFCPMHVRGGEHLPFVETTAWRYTGARAA